jgi:hypothetical protein
MMTASEPTTAVDAPLPEPMRMRQLARPFNHLLGALPKSVLAVPSMMSVPERRFLHGLARDYYVGAGIIVDAGIFLGASTRCFGEGLPQNERFREIRATWKKPIVSFERGIVNPNMPAFFARNNVPIQAQPGESFAVAVERNVAPVAELVDLRIGDICETGAVDQPIEILFLDVLKNPQIAQFACEQYFPRLIPGRSVVLQQDYFFEQLPYIKTYQEYFMDYFSYIGEIGSMAVFLCIDEIPHELTLNIEEKVGTMEQLRLASVALQRSCDPSRRFLMALSKLRLIRKLLGLKEAQNYLQFIRTEYPEQIDGMGLARLREALRSAEKLAERGQKTRDATPAGSEVDA